MVLRKCVRCRGWIDAKLLWKCCNAMHVEKEDVILQMKKLRPRELC